MGQKPTTPWGQPRNGVADSLPLAEECLVLLAEGAAATLPPMLREVYREFRHDVNRMSREISDPGSFEEKTGLCRRIVREFQLYGQACEAAIRDRETAWRGLASILFTELIVGRGIPDQTGDGAALKNHARSLTTGDEIRAWLADMDRLLHPLGNDTQAKNIASLLKEPDQSTANDNAAGLRGGGSALEHLTRLMAAGSKGFIVLFQLRCLSVIAQRFGVDAVHDCLMAIAAFLTEVLDSKDLIYHWSDTTLLAILEGRPNERILVAEVDRIIAKNRETTIHVDGRPIMVRIPLAFEVIPLSRLRTPEDLLRLAGRKTAV
jgi:GGDEF domain-containing protein